MADDLSVKLGTAQEYYFKVRCLNLMNNFFIIYRKYLKRCQGMITTKLGKY